MSSLWARGYWYGFNRCKVTARTEGDFLPFSHKGRYLFSPVSFSVSAKHTHTPSLSPPSLFPTVYLSSCKKISLLENNCLPEPLMLRFITLRSNVFSGAQSLDNMTASHNNVCVSFLCVRLVCESNLIIVVWAREGRVRIRASLFVNVCNVWTRTAWELAMRCHTKSEETGGFVGQWSTWRV